MGDDQLEGETARTVSELFETEAQMRNRPNPLGTLSRTDRTQALDGFEHAPSERADTTEQNGDEPRIVLWTLSTVAMALVAALLLGYVSVSAGEPTTAFGAGVLTGGTGLVLGFTLVSGTDL